MKKWYSEQYFPVLRSSACHIITILLLLYSKTKSNLKDLFSEDLFLEDLFSEDLLSEDLFSKDLFLEDLFSEELSSTNCKAFPYRGIIFFSEEISSQNKFILAQMNPL